MNEGGVQGPVIRLLVVADDDRFRTGLVLLLGEQARIEVVGQASGARVGVEMASELLPDVVLIDSPGPDLEGLGGIPEIVERRPDTRVLTFGERSPNNDDIEDAILAGACGYVTKDAPIDMIVAAVRAVAGGSA